MCDQWIWFFDRTHVRSRERDIWYVVKRKGKGVKCRRQQIVSLFSQYSHTQTPSRLIHTHRFTTGTTTTTRNYASVVFSFFSPFWLLRAGNKCIFHMTNAIRSIVKFVVVLNTFNLIIFPWWMTLSRSAWVCVFVSMKNAIRFWITIC